MLRKLSRQQKMKSTELQRLLTCTTVNSMKTSSRTTDSFSPTPMNLLSEFPSREGNRVVSQNHGSHSLLLIKLMSQVKYPTKRLSATLKDALKSTIQRRGKLSWPRRRIKWPRFSTWYARFTKRYSSLTLSTKQLTKLQVPKNLRSLMYFWTAWTSTILVWSSSSKTPHTTKSSRSSCCLRLPV